MLCFIRHSLHQLKKEGVIQYIAISNDTGDVYLWQVLEAAYGDVERQTTLLYSSIVGLKTQDSLTQAIDYRPLHDHFPRPSTSAVRGIANSRILIHSFVDLQLPCSAMICRRMSLASSTQMSRVYVSASFSEWCTAINRGSGSKC